MTEIIRKETKKTNKFTSEQVLAQARRVEAQRAQKAITKATKGSKDFDAMKKWQKKRNTLDRAMAGRRGIQRNCKYCRTTHELLRFQSIVGALHDVRNSTTSSVYADAWEARCQRMTNDTKFMICMKAMRTKRW